MTNDTFEMEAMTNSAFWYAYSPEASKVAQDSEFGSGTAAAAEAERFSAGPPICPPVGRSLRRARKVIGCSRRRLLEGLKHH